MPGRGVQDRLPHPLDDQIDCSTGLVRETAILTNDETDSSTGLVRETPHPHGALKRDASSAERTHRFHNAVCNRNSHKPKTRHTSTGRVREITQRTNDETDSNAGRVRETPDPVNDEIDCSTGRVRETPLPTNDKTDSSTGRVRETPHPPNDERD